MLAQGTAWSYAGLVPYSNQQALTTASFGSITPASVAPASVTSAGVDVVTEGGGTRPISARPPASTATHTPPPRHEIPVSGVPASGPRPLHAGGCQGRSRPLPSRRPAPGCRW